MVFSFFCSFCFLPLSLIHTPKSLSAALVSFLSPYFPALRGDKLPAALQLHATFSTLGSCKKGAHPGTQALLPLLYSHPFKTITEEWWIKAVRYPWIRVPHLAGIIKYMLNSTQHTSITFDISRNPFLFHSQLMNPEMMAATIAVSFKVLLM